jgi:nucleotide-binding universal stress UspA family protein
MVILAAVGESEDQEKIIEAAHDLATAYEDELRVLHVIPENDADDHFESIRAIEEFKNISFSVEIDRAEHIAETFIEGALETDSAKGVSAMGRVGNAADEILSVAKSLNPRYLVIGGRKRSAVGKAIFGSVTQSVILKADQTVVAVKPDV